MIDFMRLKTYLKKKYIKIKIYKNVLTNENLKSRTQNVYTNCMFGNILYSRSICIKYCIYTVCFEATRIQAHIYISHERITHLLKLEYRSTPHTRLIFGRLLC